MSEAWKGGTRIVSAPEVSAAVTVVLDDVDEAAELVSDALSEVDLSSIEVRASFAGPSRGSNEALADILVVVQQIGLGAAGSGVWVAVQSMVERVARWRRRSNPTLATAEQTVTIMIPTANGPALVQRVSVGPRDQEGERESFERIVTSMIESIGQRPD